MLAIESTKRREIQTPIPLDEPQDENDDEDDDELLDAPEAEDDGVVSEIDWGRTLRFTLIGATFLAPALHTWYGVLMRRLPGTAPATVVKRVALDQLVFSPVFLAAFLSTVMVLDGRAAKVRGESRKPARVKELVRVLFVESWLACTWSPGWFVFQASWIVRRKLCYGRVVSLFRL